MVTSSNQNDSTADSSLNNGPTTNGSIKIPSSGIENGTANGVGALPRGKYILVGVDIDTTGRRLIDEIVQLAAFTPTDHYEQYIMPYMNLNPAARQRHQVRVISIGFYRMLKSMQTYKIIKSKSEIAALRDFLDWLEALKSKDADALGIVLVYHEERKFIPYMILESLKKYNLLDRFLATVKSFVNGLNLAKKNMDATLQHCSLRKLSKIFNDKRMKDTENTCDSTTDNSSNNNKNNNSSNNNSPTNEGHSQSPQKSIDFDLFDGNASVRAKLAFEVALHLSNEGRDLGAAGNGLNSSEAYQNMLNALEPYAQPIESELNELKTQNENLERQNSFRPVFLNYFKTTLYHRVRAVKFRIILAENGYDLQNLSDLWGEKQKDGIAQAIDMIKDLKSEDKQELVELLDSYFDPNKPTIKPAKSNRRRNRRGGRFGKNGNGGGSNYLRLNNNNRDGNNNNNNGGGNNNEQGAGGDKQASVGSNQLPDSTTKSPPRQQQQQQQQQQQAHQQQTGGGGKPPRNRRNARSRNNSMKTGGTQSNMMNNNAPTAVPVAAAN